MNAYVLVTMLPLLGVIAGLGRVVSPRVPFIAAGLVIALYAMYVAFLGVWAGTCWDCASFDDSRGEIFFVAGFFFGFLTLTTLLAIWLGARFVTVLQRLLRTWREIRGDRDHPAREPGA